MSQIRRISVCAAKKRYGVVCNYGVMENGERRFRLSREGYGYILTLAPDGGGWQDCHYHLRLRETYIVQKGWIIYAALKDGKPERKVFGPNGQFTTEPTVAHTIYMSIGAVAHTVKHGDTSPSDRYEDKAAVELCKQLEPWFGKESELAKKSGIALVPNQESSAKQTRKPSIFSKLFSAAIDMKPQGRIEYSDAYKHFDNLIWQVPAWTTAIFSIAVGFEKNIDLSAMFPADTSIGPSLAKCMLYCFLGIALFFLGYALFRFRAHQVLSKAYTTRSWPFSPQSWLQIVVNLEAGLLVLFGIKVAYVSSSLIYEWLIIGIVFVMAIVIAVVFEFGLKWISRNRSKFVPS